MIALKIANAKNNSGMHHSVIIFHKLIHVYMTYTQQQHKLEYDEQYVTICNYFLNEMFKRNVRS